MPGPIRLGDKTTGGGVVISCQLGNFWPIDGIPGAVLGDMATCPKHKGVFPFVECDNSTTFTEAELGVVLEGHKLACGCYAISSVAVTFDITPTSPMPFETPVAAPTAPSGLCLDCLLKAAAAGSSTVMRG